MSDKMEIEKLKFELLMVSKLASDNHGFTSSLNEGHAKQIRDRVLKDQPVTLKSDND